MLTPRLLSRDLLHGKILSALRSVSEKSRICRKINLDWAADMLHAPDNRDLGLRVQLDRPPLGKILDIKSCWLFRNDRFFHRRRFNPFPSTCISNNLRKLSSRWMPRRAFPHGLNRHRERSSLHWIKGWWNQWVSGVYPCGRDTEPQDENARADSKETDLPHRRLQTPSSPYWVNLNIATAFTRRPASATPQHSAPRPPEHLPASLR
jgi:hypothetical protein